MLLTFTLYDSAMSNCVHLCVSVGKRKGLKAEHWPLFWKKSHIYTEESD